MSSKVVKDTSALSLLMTRKVNISGDGKNSFDDGGGKDDTIANAWFVQQNRQQEPLSSSPTCVVSVSSTLQTVTQASSVVTTTKKPSLPSTNQDYRYTETATVEWPMFPTSEKSLRTHNPIRAILDPILSSVDNGDASSYNKPRISLAVRIQLHFLQRMQVCRFSHFVGRSILCLHLQLGDPIAANASSSSSSLQPCPIAIRAIMDVLSTAPMKTASYTNALGTIEGRNSIAKYHSHPYYAYNPNSDVIIANGCSGALELIITALLLNDDEISILLVPEPGFPLYRVIAESHGAMVVPYRLLPEQKWEIDLIHLQSTIMEIQQQQYEFIVTTTQRQDFRKKKMCIRGVVVNNPSNPTGAVYDEQHLVEIIQLCNVYHIPIIADEIYGDLIFDNHDSKNKFIPMAQISAQMGRTVPIVTASGIGKQFLLPGWRVGWICFQDKYVMVTEMHPFLCFWWYVRFSCSLSILLQLSLFFLDETTF
jgi:tyrosine aminotransferase